MKPHIILLVFVTRIVKWLYDLVYRISGEIQTAKIKKEPTLREQIETGEFSEEFKKKFSREHAKNFGPWLEEHRRQRIASMENRKPRIYGTAA